MNGRSSMNVNCPIRNVFHLAPALALIACVIVWLNFAGIEPAGAAEKFPTIGSIERLDPRFDALVAADAQMERLADGFDWSEGPVWIAAGNFLLFSDVPQNTVFRWKEGEGISVFLKPSGYTGTEARGGEPGSNGLILDAQQRLVLCQHGDRRVARLEPLSSNGKFITLADRHEAKRFNSPNDGVYHSSGALYFTDPPYGLAGGPTDPKREIAYNGVYRLSPDGKVALLTREVKFPNGIGLSPDEKTLYVASSDSDYPVWWSFPLAADGTLGKGRIFFDATKLLAGAKGLPDGLEVDRHGNVFATGPGGVLVFAPDGSHLGTFQTGEATANCGWGDDGSTLYITADMYLVRVKTKTSGPSR